MKKTIALLLSVFLLLTLFSGCDNTKQPQVDATTTQADTTASNPTVTEAPPATDESQPNPESDFWYEVTEDDEIAITGYIGSNTEVIIPSLIEEKNVVEIRWPAFCNNKRVVFVKIPDSVNRIDSFSFENCTSLKTVALPADLEIIEARTFANCTSLSNIELPDSLTSINSAAFANCTSLKHITIPGNCLNDSSYECFADSGLETIELKEGVTMIPQCAFIGTKIEGMILPSTVKSIQIGAFAECQLKSVRLNDGLESIAMTAFSGNQELTEIVIPKTVISCSEYSFTSCENLKAVKFEGDAPGDFFCDDDFFHQLFSEKQPDFTVYYHQNANGFTFPVWNRYPTAIW